MTNKRLITIPLLVILAAGLVFIWQKSDRTIEIDSQLAQLIPVEGEGLSPLSGLSCQNYQQRPLAIVLANDPVTRPLSGLSQADLVIEMLVITNSITRLMAFFVCNQPEKIGSLRSARHDFIPLAQGLDAILVHWGGSHFALDKLDAGIMDNIDALKNPYNSFYRDNSKPQPHNGFTSIDRLTSAASKLNYRSTNLFEGYSFIKENNQGAVNRVLGIGYSRPYYVSYQYDSGTNSYLRYRDNLREMDVSNDKQIEAKNIVVMRVFSKQIEGPDYNDLDLEGGGDCQIYQNGVVLDCTWQKSEIKPFSKLKFVDSDGQEIPFVPGQTWIEIVEPNQEVTWN
ncbi:DUF3048 domain-containing protein [Patescibacteria group bacterium]|nr:DUF3048 domain-containing protein [Patescibacteria group bacterium]MBU1563526.1 DUF3048 domain-containing protein [Patescibacteria group bacterium]MBU2068262.1 DUF3048 domain-containing protein [Patescibacteria group bacterium]